MAREKYPSAKLDQYMVRFPEGMRDRLKDAAANNKRSMNAEIIERIEDSFSPKNTALLEATKVAESLRNNLTDRLDSYDRLHRTLEKRIENFAKREERLVEREMALETSIEGQLEARREELEKEYQLLLDMAEKRWQQADEYAGFTIARERQFVETIKSLTGEEPAPVDPVVRLGRVDRRKRIKAPSKDDDAPDAE